MKYTKENKAQLINHLRDRYMTGTAEGHEIAITLVILANKGTIEQKDIKDILMEVHLGNEVGVASALEKAEKLIDMGLLERVDV